MNVSATLQEVKKKPYELTQKQRLMVLGAIGFIAVFIFFYTSTADVEVDVKPNPPSTNSQASGKTFNQTENLVNQTAQIMRDPFAVLPQLDAQTKVTAPSVAPTIPNNVSRNVPGSVPKSVIPAIPYGNYGNLKLTGVVGNGDQNLAVIKSANSSKSYSVNEFIGADRIIAITNDSVILGNGDKKSVLRLEQVGQKGGNNSEN